MALGTESTLSSKSINCPKLTARKHYDLLSETVEEAKNVRKKSEEYRFEFRIGLEHDETSDLNPLCQGTTPRRFTLKFAFQEFQLSAILASHFVAKLLFWGLEAGPKGV